ncbi:gliding motility-associated C-terminal domain-containing protein [Cytophagaceae bacterium ABcell3]|nr:gliding motility-associated C-terminal domain-containing protein [Cytophagaceae bacterium ABcell3]
MKKSFCFFIGLIISFLASGHKPPEETPLKFIENKGQWHDYVLFKSEIPSGALFFEKDGFTWNVLDPTLFDLLHAHSPAKNQMRLKGHSWKMKFKNASQQTSVSGQQKRPEHFNFFLGKDSEKWASGVSAFTELYYNSLYENIDMKVYTSKTSVKYDFIIQPEGDPSQISMEYDGVDNLSLRNGDLIIETSVGEIIETKPYAYQIQGSEKKTVPCNFKIQGKRVYFEFPSGYDQSATLIIDPELIFSTFSGSFSDNFGYTATFDSDGFLYSGSTSFGRWYPTTVGAYDREFNGGIVDIAITKYDTTGTFMIYSTFLGGESDEMPHSMIVNNRDELYVFGTTGSPDFPVTENAYDTTFKGGPPINYIPRGMGTYFPDGTDMFVTKFNQDGTDLLGSTLIGGTNTDGLGTHIHLLYNYADEVRGEIDIDQEGSVYIASCTRSTDFPVTANAVQTEHAGELDGCVVKLKPDLSDVEWSTFLGGSHADALYSIAFDSTGQVYVAGGTASLDAPVTDGILQPNHGTGRSDGYIASISKDGSDLLRATFYGYDSYDQIYFIETDHRNNVYVLGQTEAEGETYIYNAEYNHPNSGQFITKFTSGLDSIIWSTAFGTGSGAPDISPTAFLVDHCQKIYLAGWGGEANQLGRNNAGYTTGLDITANAFQSTTNGSDFYLMVLEDDASFLSYATFMGGPVSNEHVDGGTSRFDRSGKIYHAACAGCGYNSDFPIHPNPGAVSPTNNHSCNSAVFKIDFDMPAMDADFLLPELTCNLDLELNFENRSTSHNSTRYFWDFGDGTTSTEKNPQHTYSEGGNYLIKLIVADSGTCNLSDTTYQEIVVRPDSIWNLPDTTVCPGTELQMGRKHDEQTDHHYTWIPENGLNDPTIPDPILEVTESQEYALVISYSNCSDTLFHQINADSINVGILGDTVICHDSPPLELVSQSNGNPVRYYWSTNPDFDPILNQSPLDSSYSADPMDTYNTYYVKIYNEKDCPATDSITIRVSNVSVAVPDTIICNTDPLELLAIGEPEDLSYTWQPHSSIQSPTDGSVITVQPDTTTQYTVTATNEDNCTATATANVSISGLFFDPLEAEISADTIWQGERVTLTVRPEHGYIYNWTPADGLNNANAPRVGVYPDANTTWTVTVTDPVAENCQRDTTLSVVVKEVFCGPQDIFVPNAFSPNGDGLNDILYVRGENIYELYFTVYNRWGEKVFETKNKDIGWDGTYKGRAADPGVFVYYLEAKCPGERKYFEKGNITLLR